MASVRELKRQLNKCPGDLDALERFVQITCEETFNPDVVAHVRRAVELCSTDPRAHMLQARVLLEQGRFDEALQSLATAAEHGASEDELDLMRITLAFAMRDPETLEAIARGAILRDPRNPTFKRMLAAMFAVDGRASEVLELIEPHLADSPVSSEDLALCAGAYQELGRFDRARMIFERLVRLDPENSEAVVGLATCLFDSGREEDGLALLEEFLTDHPKDSVVLLALFDLYVDRRHLRDAVEIGRRVLRLDDSAAMRQEIATVHVQLGEYEIARTHLQRALGLVGPQAEIRTVLAQVLSLLGRDEEAEQQLVLSEQQGADPCDVALTRSAAHLRRGNHELALETALRAVELDASSADAHHLCAAAYFALHQQDKCESSLQQGLALDAEHPELLELAAVKCSIESRPDDAKAFLNRLALVDPARAEELRIERRLE